MPRCHTGRRGLRRNTGVVTLVVPPCKIPPRSTCPPSSKTPKSSVEERLPPKQEVEGANPTGGFLFCRITGVVTLVVPPCQDPAPLNVPRRELRRNALCTSCLLGVATFFVCRRPPPSPESPRRIQCPAPHSSRPSKPRMGKDPTSMVNALNGNRFVDFNC